MYGCGCVKSLQSNPTVCNTMDPMDHSSPGFSDHGILQARILEWVVIPSSRGLPKPGTEPVCLPSPELTRDRRHCLFTTSATWKDGLNLTGSLFCVSSLVYLYFSLNRNSLQLNYLCKTTQLLLFSHSVVSNSLQPHGLQHSRLLCPPLSLEFCLNSCPLSQ